ncbi:hypothetical protein B296_00051874, partial [Ensete ventricosum]
YESYIDVEIQQRAVEYIALCKKGAALVDVLAEMPKFPERQVEEASTQDQSSFHQGMIKENGVVTEVVPQAVPPADLLGDLLGPLAINGSPAIAVPVEQRNQNLLSVLEATPEAASPLALTTIDNQPDSIQVPY